MEEQRLPKKFAPGLQQEQAREDGQEAVGERA